MKIALIIIALIIALVGVYKRDTWPLWVTFAISGLLVLAAVIQIVVEVREAKEIAKGKYTGKLENSQILLSPQQRTLPKLELGDGGTVFSFAGPQGEPLFKIFEDNALTILLEDGKVKVSTIVRNKTGAHCC